MGNVHPPSLAVVKHSPLTVSATARGGVVRWHHDTRKRRLLSPRTVNFMQRVGDLEVSVMRPRKSLLKSKEQVRNNDIIAARLCSYARLKHEGNLRSRPGDMR